VHSIFEAQTDIALDNLPKVYEALGDSVQAVSVCGTDFGTQSSQFCSPSTFSSLYAPYYRRINGWVHAHTPWKTFKHSCGAIVPLLPSLIEAGFDIINPVQCSAKGMDPQFLKREFGSRLVFWGGGVDTQHTLPFGTPEQVRAEVLHRCEIFGRDGGFVFNAIHNVQANTPVENVVAMVDAVKEFNRLA
jgi:uroporphyrinogen-III decarboxylase